MSMLSQLLWTRPSKPRRPTSTRTFQNRLANGRKKRGMPPWSRTRYAINVLDMCYKYAVYMFIC